MAGRPKAFGHQRFPANGWSISGAERAQPVATGGKWDALENRSNRPIRNRWQPTATVPERMVKVDHLLAKEGVASLAPQGEVEPPNPRARRLGSNLAAG